jgi:hypothetical protein
MHSTLVSELWYELKRHIPASDRADAAETVVAVLVNNDEDIDDIKTAFKSDREIKTALMAYLDTEKSYDEEDEEEYEDEEDNDEW